MTDEELIKLYNLRAPTTETVVLPEFRLYYDSEGRAITYTCEHLAGSYIVVTHQQYSEARNDVVVKNGKITYTNKVSQFSKMIKNSSEGTKTSKYDINILTDVDFVFWKYEQYEIT